MNTESDTVAYKSKERVYVTVQLDEIKRIRDELAKIRNHHPLIRGLFSQVAGLSQRLEQEAQAANPKK